MDLQYYPRNRMSNRLQKSDAQESKKFSTFPLMAGSSFVRISVEQELPLKSFDIFLYTKDFFIKNQSPTVGRVQEILSSGHFQNAGNSV
jgi:hypothetical protein